MRHANDLDPDDVRRNVIARLEILDAFDVALAGRKELMEIVASAPSADDARRAVMTSFGLSEVQAVAILDLQVRRFAELERRRIGDERRELRAKLDSLNAAADGPDAG